MLCSGGVEARRAHVAGDRNVVSVCVIGRHVFICVCLAGRCDDRHVFPCSRFWFGLVVVLEAGMPVCVYQVIKTLPVCVRAFFVRSGIVLKAAIRVLQLLL